MTSDTYYYKRGTNIQFSQPSHVFDPSSYSDDELQYNTEKDIIPIAIHCVAQEGSDGIYLCLLLQFILLLLCSFHILFFILKYFL